MFLCSGFASAADTATNAITFTNRFGRVFASVRIEKADGEFISWVSATNAFIFGRCPVNQLTRETYQRLGVTDSEVSDAVMARAKAQHQTAVRPKVDAKGEVALARKADSLSGRVSRGMTAAELERVLRLAE